MLNRVLEASWLELAGPKQFLLYGSAVKAQFTHLTSCLTTVLQHTLCYHADNDRHFHEAVSICMSWANTLLRIGISAVELANSPSDTGPKELKSFGLINDLWTQLLRFLTDCPEPAKDPLRDSYQAVFHAAWFQLQVCLAYKGRHCGVDSCLTIKCVLVHLSGGYSGGCQVH